MVERDVDIKVFNTAKKFAEDILFPLMKTYCDYRTQSDFGSQKLEEALMLDEEVKEIGRYNGLKAMNDIVSNLLTAISSTVLLKKNKDEIEQLNSLKETVERVKKLFYERKDDFFVNGYDGVGGIKEKINRDFFEKVKAIVQTCYINTEVLMTRNKLLFNDASDEFKDDKQLLNQIKEEYING